MSIYEPVSKDVLTFVNSVKDEYFSELSDCRLTAIFDNREKRKNFIAKIYKSNELLRFFTSDEAGEEDGYDYIMVFDQLVWESDAITEADRKRIVRHELRHAWYRPEKRTRKGQYSLCKHDVESFMVEIILLQQEGEPNWEQKVKEIASSIYDIMEDKEV